MRSRLSGGTAVIRLLAVAVAVVISSGLVLSGSRAAFTGTTDNTGNSLAAGTVTLTDDDSGSVLFNVTAMRPGDSSVNCIVVTYNGSVDPAAVKVYSGGYTDSDDLANWLNVTIERGTGGSFGDCSTFSSEATLESGGDLIAFNTDHTNYTNGTGTWDPSGSGQSKTYRITLALDGSTPNSQQGDSVTALGFTWETQTP